MHLLWIPLALYFLPTLIAAARHHHNVGSILIINLFLGWTFVGWVVALAMACGRVLPNPIGAYAPATYERGVLLDQPSARWEESLADWIDYTCDSFKSWFNERSPLVRRASAFGILVSLVVLLLVVHFFFREGSDSQSRVSAGGSTAEKSGLLAHGCQMNADQTKAFAAFGDKARVEMIARVATSGCDRQLDLIDLVVDPDRTLPSYTCHYSLRQQATLAGLTGLNQVAVVHHPCFLQEVILDQLAAAPYDQQDRDFMRMRAENPDLVGDDYWNNKKANVLAHEMHDELVTRGVLFND